MIEYINVKGLSKSYDGIQAIHDISFSVQPGEVFTLVGENGAGKTTIIECIEGFLEPDSGEITVYWMDVSQNKSMVQKSVGIQLQNPSLPNHMTVREAMELFCAWHRVDYRSDLLKRFDIGGEYLNRPYAKLSEDRKRRLHLALALCHKPKVLILDEPSQGLDAQGRTFLQEEIKRLRSDGICILMTTRDIAEAGFVSDKIAIVKKGTIESIRKPDEIASIRKIEVPKAESANEKKIDIKKDKEITTIAKTQEPTHQEPTHQERSHQERSHRDRILQADVKNKVIIKTLKGCLKDDLPSDFGKPVSLENDYLLFICLDAIEFMMNLLPYIRKCGDTIIDIRVVRTSNKDRATSARGGESR